MPENTSNSTLCICESRFFHCVTPYFITPSSVCLNWLSFVSSSKVTGCICNNPESCIFVSEPVTFNWYSHVKVYFRNDLAGKTEKLKNKSNR